MFIKSINICNFRNYSEASFTFNDKINIIYGKNAIGKTNLLEAINIIATLKSFKTNKLKECIKFSENSFNINANIYTQNTDVNISLNISDTTNYLINDIKHKKTPMLKTISFTPDDLIIIRDYADSRRKFLDDLLCQLRPNYNKYLKEYNKYLKHKNKILKDGNPVFLEMLDDYSFKMAELGANIIWYRASFIKKLESYSKIHHLNISNNTENLTLNYKSIPNDFSDINIIKENLINHYFQHKNAEIYSKTCLSGCHKDDFIININDISAKNFASRGQIRTISISLKLAAKDIFKDDTGFNPIMLLDDILSELDDIRCEFILNKIQDCQVFITSPQNFNENLYSIGL